MHMRVFTHTHAYVYVQYIQYIQYIQCTQNGEKKRRKRKEGKWEIERKKIKLKISESIFYLLNT